MATTRWKVEYAQKVTYYIWADSALQAETGVELKPDYVETIASTSLGGTGFSVGNTVYYFNDPTDSILQGTITSIAYPTPDTANVFVQFPGQTTQTMFAWPTQTDQLYLVLQDLLDYLQRELP